MLSVMREENGVVILMALKTKALLFNANQSFFRCLFVILRLIIATHYKQ